jgi:hypothetical protein
MAGSVGIVGLCTLNCDRTHHEAVPVLRGTEFAANFWIHQYDYVTAHHRGCTFIPGLTYVYV